MKKFIKSIFGKLKSIYDRIDNSKFRQAFLNIEKNSLKIILSIVVIIGFTEFFRVWGFFFRWGIPIFSTDEGREGGITIDGLRFEEDTFIFSLIILFNYWLFWGFKNKSDNWKKYRKPKDHKGVE